jgi:L-serine dehydratase
LRFEALDNQNITATWEVYSIGEGVARSPIRADSMVYDLNTLFRYSRSLRQPETEYVEEREGLDIWSFLKDVWQAMSAAIDRGLRAEGVLPGGLGLPRKAWAFYRKANMSGPHLKRLGTLSAYALAVSEENAAGGVVVTAPTCGSSGIVPAVLRYLQENVDNHEEVTLRALRRRADGNLQTRLIPRKWAAAQRAACAMARSGGTVFKAPCARWNTPPKWTGASPGPTCDPVGPVQIRIERNVFAASRALTCADCVVLRRQPSHLVR